MKLHYLLVFFVLLLTQPVAGQNAWSKLYNLCIDTSIYASNALVVYADDSFFIAAGNTYTPGVSDYHSYLAKINYKGELLAKKPLYFPGQYNVVSTGYNLIKISNNRYMLAANDWDFDTNQRVALFQPYYYFFDDNLDSLNYVKYVDTVITRLPKAVCIDNKKSIMVTGQISSDSLIYDSFMGRWVQDSIFLWITKYDSNAREIWSKKYFSSSYTIGDKIIPASDNSGYLLTGSLVSLPSDTTMQMVMKIDVDGDLLWVKKFPQSYSGMKTDITPLYSGGYAFAATCNDTSFYGTYYGGASYAYLQYGKLDDNGDTLWVKRFQPDYPAGFYSRNITEADNGDWIIFSRWDYALAPNAVLRVTADGEVRSYREYDYVPPDIYKPLAQKLEMMVPTPDGRLLLGGYLSTDTNYPSYFDSTGTFSWFVLTDTFGCLEPGCQSIDTMWHTGIEEIDQPLAFEVYPNPLNDILHIRSASSLSNAIIELIDMSGRLLGKYHIATETAEISTAGLPFGMYILMVKKNNIVIGHKKIEKL